MFLSIEELVDQAKAYSSVAELMIAVEMEMSGRSRSQIIAIMEKNLSVMEQSINEGKEGVTSVTGITGGDAKKLDDYLNDADFLSGETILKAVRNAVAVNEVNAKMGLICATPTAGSAGVVPGVLMAVRDRLGLSHEQQLEFLFTAGAFGLVIANNASISGAEGVVKQKLVLQVQWRRQLWFAQKWDSSSSSSSSSHHIEKYDGTDLRSCCRFS